jgi:erythromycin esterase-like protein
MSRPYALSTWLTTISLTWSRWARQLVMARIVFLGEEWHGSGATFQARNRVIRFLHERCGFNLLAFEGGLYDCRQAWEFLKEGKMPALDAASYGIF